MPDLTVTAHEAPYSSVPTVTFDGTVYGPTPSPPPDPPKAPAPVERKDMQAELGTEKDLLAIHNKMPATISVAKKAFQPAVDALHAAGVAALTGAQLGSKYECFVSKSEPTEKGWTAKSSHLYLHFNKKGSPLRPLWRKTEADLDKDGTLETAYHEFAFWVKYL